MGLKNGSNEVHPLILSQPTDVGFHLEYYSWLVIEDKPTPLMMKAQPPELLLRKSGVASF